MARTILLFFVLLGTAAQAVAAPAAPFSRGVNLSGWLQAGSPGEIAYHRYTKRDFEHIRNLGCDVIRLPINLHFMTGGAPDYVLDREFLAHLDEVVGWAEELELHLVLDNHTFDPATETDPAVRDVLVKVWTQVARHYRDRSEYIYYEVLNEPHGIDDAVWNDIQQDVVDAIRAVDQTHYIVVGPANWNSYANLDEMPVYDDDRLIYTFHFYDPFLFSHQGATWGSPSMAELAGVPFPYRAEDMPALPESLRGTWVEDAYNRYPQEGTVEAVQQALDAAIEFSEQRQVPMLAGEFGVLMGNSPDEDRIGWYRTVREYMEANGMAWTSWDYHGGFGLFETASGGEFEHDLNTDLLEALGLTVPPQTPRVPSPDTAGFDIYLDSANTEAVFYGSNAGSVDTGSTDRPYEGNRAIRWSGAAAYAAIGFDFQPDRDLQYLVDQGYGIELAVRSETPVEELGVRFMDTDTDDPEDRPWRMNFVLDTTRLEWDGNWHRVFVPLAEIEEQGAWEDGEWYGPEGLFDWSAIDRLEVSVGAAGLGSAVVGLDAIRVAAVPTGEPGLSNDAGLSGLFFDPAASGHGFDFNVIDAGLVVYYYGHTADGERLWLISALVGDNLAFGEPIEMQFFEVANGTFGAPVEPATPWGIITLTLDSCTSGSAIFDGLDGQMEMDLVRLADVPGLGCSR
jgi:endoglucanase